MAESLDGQRKRDDVKVSVICSNYNSDRWIDGYLEAVDNQTLKNFELIVVDAASTDGSLMKILKHEPRDGVNFLIYPSEERIPIYEAWNKAIDVASGEYCVNWNTDDRIYPDGLEAMSEYLDKHKDVDLVYGHCAVTHEEDHSVQSGVYRWGEFSINELLSHCYMGPFPMWRKESVASIGKFDPSYPIIGDYEMWLRMASCGQKIERIDKIIGMYYHNPEGMSTNDEHLAQHDKEKARVQDIYTRIFSGLHQPQ